MNLHSLKDKKIAIIGSGIGGLTFANALCKQGLSPMVYESKKNSDPVGAGIILGPNAMQVFKRLDLYSPLLESGHSLDGIPITDHLLKPLLNVNWTNIEAQFSIRPIAIKRHRLSHILCRKLNDKAIFYNKKVIQVTDQGKQVKILFEDGSYEEHIDLLIGADGINSSVRNYVRTDCQKRDAKQHCWRAVIPFQLPSNILHKNIDALGIKNRFGFVQANQDDVYWYALNRMHASDKIAPEFPASDFEYYHPLVSNLIRATPKEKIIYSTIADLPNLNIWYKNRVCLLGDAAHTTTPNMGQGAGQAIEDAWTLSQLLINEPDIETAFRLFMQKRKAKVDFVIKNSWSSGKYSLLEKKWQCSLRNKILKAIPNQMIQSKDNFLYTIDPS